MQLLRMGLVNYTTLGKTFQKENKDFYIIVALVVNGGEFLICIMCLIICLKLNYDYKNNRFKTNRKEGAFFVQVVSDKDIVVVQSKSHSSNNSKNGLINSLNNLKSSGVLI
jgi:3'-phosphoadenosine 5'-phosphosulfate (PAPS) 3'-phosphatase